MGDTKYLDFGNAKRNSSVSKSPPKKVTFSQVDGQSSISSNNGGENSHNAPIFKQNPSLVQNRQIKLSDEVSHSHESFNSDSNEEGKDGPSFS